MAIASKNNKQPKVLDLFSGCGGLSYGFLKAGFDVVAGVDNWKDALITFQKNHPYAKALQLDLSDFEPAKLKKKVGTGIDVVVGGPPCQGFSISGKRNPGDPRNKLYKGFVETVRHFNPRAFVLENVPNLVSMQKGAIRDKIVFDFSDLGYTVNWNILDASDFGVPQKRKRVFFVGLLEENEFDFPRANTEKHITAEEAISDLPEETTEEGASYSRPPLSGFQKKMRRTSKGVYNHVATIHTSQTKKIVDMVPDGGNYKDLPEHLHPTRKVNIAWTRLDSKKPSFTIDTGHNHIFHYKFNRVPTARESARIQTFPDSFVFYGGKTSQLVQIGNAVPPFLAQAIGAQLFKYL